MDDDYIQPGNLYGLMPADKLECLVKNSVGSLSKDHKEIQVKVVAHFTCTDMDYVGGIA